MLEIFSASCFARSGLIFMSSAIATALVCGSGSGRVDFADGGMFLDQRHWKLAYVDHFLARPTCNGIKPENGQLRLIITPQIDCVDGDMFVLELH
jgi:hypothetical protein